MAFKAVELAEIILGVQREERLRTEPAYSSLWSTEPPGGLEEHTVPRHVPKLAHAETLEVGPRSQHLKKHSPDNYNAQPGLRISALV